MQQVASDVKGPRSSDPPAMPAVPRRQRTPRRASRFLILLVSVVLLGNALVGESGLISLIRAGRQVAAVSGLIDALRAENDELREDVRSLREEPRAIEDLARRDLGLIEPGEKVFIIGAAREAEPETSGDLGAPSAGPVGSGRSGAP